MGEFGCKESWTKMCTNDVNTNEPIKHTAILDGRRSKWKKSNEMLEWMAQRVWQQQRFFFLNKWLGFVVNIAFWVNSNWIVWERYIKFYWFLASTTAFASFRLPTKCGIDFILCVPCALCFSNINPHAYATMPDMVLAFANTYCVLTTAIFPLHSLTARFHRRQNDDTN